MSRGFTSFPALQVYAGVLEVSEPNVHECRMGIFLSRDLRHAYDSWQWSLYYKVSTVLPLFD